MISSINNVSVKATAKLVKQRERDRRRMCLVEGHRAVSVALESGVHVPLLFHTQAARARSGLLDTASRTGSKISEVTSGVMAHLTTHAHPPDVVAVASQRVASAKKAVSGAFVVVLAAVRDPAVAGGILASAAGAGVTGVVSLAGSTDPFAPVAIRAGAGAQFALPIARDVLPQDLNALLGDRSVYLLSERGEPVFSVGMQEPLAMVVGESDAFASASLITVPGLGPAGPAVGPGLVARAAIALYQVRRAG